MPLKAPSEPKKSKTGKKKVFIEPLPPTADQVGYLVNWKYLFLFCKIHKKAESEAATPSSIMSSSLPVGPNPSMASSVTDLDEFRLIHSQIQRGLHDLQAGLKKASSAGWQIMTSF